MEQTTSKDEPHIGLIVEGCKAGNRSSQEKLYRYFHGYALSVCLRYAKNKEEAVEIMNDGFFKAFNHLDKYDRQYPFHTWLRRILINTAIDYHRKHHKQPPSLELTEDFHGLADDTTDWLEMATAVDALPIVQMLSPAYRMVFNLYVMEGYKHHEIAEQLGISISTSKTNLARATARLKVLVLEQMAKEGVANKGREINRFSIGKRKMVE